MSIAEVEAKIRAAVAEAKSRGVKIRQNIYYVAGTPRSSTACCVLGACVLDDNIDELDKKAMIGIAAADKIGIDVSDAYELMCGFDVGGRRSEFGQLGERLRDLVDP